MSEFKDLIKKELEEDFTPKFQELNKAMGVAPAGSGSGSVPPKGMSPAAPKTPTAAKPKGPSLRSKLTTQPKAPKMANQDIASSTATPKVPAVTGIKKQSMDENSPSQDKYHIHYKGQRITNDDETITLPEVEKQYGGVKNLESKGFRLVPHKEKKFKKNEEIYSEVMGGHKPKFLGDIRELAKKTPELALAALPYELSKKAEVGKVIVGEHVPNKVAPPPKSKKLKDKDEGSGGQISKEELSKDVVSISTGKRVNATKKRLENQPAKPSDKSIAGSDLNREPKQPEPKATSSFSEETKGLSRDAKIKAALKRQAEKGSPYASTRPKNGFNKDEIPANKIIKPSDSKEMEKCGQISKEEGNKCSKCSGKCECK